MRWSRVGMVAVVVVGAALACDKGSERAGVAKDEVKFTDQAAQSRGGGIGGVSMNSAAPAPALARPGSRTEGSMAEEGDLAQNPSAEPNMPPQSSLPVDAVAPMIVRTGSATIQVDSLELAVAQLRLLAQQLGGYVGNTSMETGSNQVRSASVELKIPARRWNELLTGLRPIGKREALTESAQDVGEEFVDVTARVANAHRLEDRLVALLANRTGKLSDALSVERELARVRLEIERYEGRIRYLRSQAAVSTMIVNLHEPLPVLGSQPGSNPIAEAFRAAWRNFVGFIAGLISFLGVLVPLAALGVLIWWLVRRIWPNFPKKKSE
jgi:hypothetical protein